MVWVLVTPSVTGLPAVGLLVLLGLLPGPVVVLEADTSVVGVLVPTIMRETIMCLHDELAIFFLSECMSYIHRIFTFCCD